MTTDPALEVLVKNLVFNSATMTSAQFNAAFQNMLYEWAGATNVSPTDYGPHIDGQHLAGRALPCLRGNGFNNVAFRQKRFIPYRYAA